MKYVAIFAAALACALVVASNLEPTEQPPPFDEGAGGISPVIWPVSVVNFPDPQEVSGTVKVPSLGAPGERAVLELLDSEVVLTVVGVEPDGDYVLDSWVSTPIDTSGYSTMGIVSVSEVVYDDTPQGFPGVTCRMLWEWPEDPGSTFIARFEGNGHEIAINSERYTPQETTDPDFVPLVNFGRIIAPTVQVKCSGGVASGAVTDPIAVLHQVKVYLFND